MRTGCAADQELAGGDLAVAEDRVRELAAAGADEPVEAEDLAAMEREVDARGGRSKSRGPSPRSITVARSIRALAQLRDALLAADHQRDQRCRVIAGHRLAGRGDSCRRAAPSRGRRWRRPPRACG